MYQFTAKHPQTSTLPYPNDLTPPAVCNWEPPQAGDLCVRCHEWPAGYSMPGSEAKYCWPCLCAVHAVNRGVGHAAD